MEKLDIISGLEYEKALEKGLKECFRFPGQGKAKQLLSIEEVLQPDESRTEKELGFREIPLNRIVGTASPSRKNAFSPSFLPLLDRDTEFADKWVNVYRHQVKDGLRDAIETYEYKGLHYVREGNKRVSVLKWLGSATVKARVIRIIPAFNPADAESRRHHAFYLFEQVTGISSLWFSSEAGFDRMTRILEEFAAPDPMTHASCKQFMDSVHYPFRLAFKESGGDRMNMTTGDALLEYLRVYPSLKPFAAATESEMAENLKKLMRGFRYYNDKSANVTESAPEGSGKARLRRHPMRLSPAVSQKMHKKPAANPLKVAFLHLADKDGSTWTKAHCKGIDSVSDYLPSGAVSSCMLANEGAGIEEAVAALVESGSCIIACTAPSLFDKVLQVALEYPDIRFFQCSPLPSNRHMTTYYGKLYEPLFLIGLIAGMTTRTGILGWLGPSGQPGSLTAANAFLLGARTVRPGTRLIWTTGNGNTADPQSILIDRWEDPDMIRLVLEGADCLLTAPDDGFATRGQTGLIPFALLCPQDGTPCTSENCLASVAWDWADFYGRLFSQWVDHRGNWPRHPAKPPFISFLGGMDSGLTDISWKPESFPPETRKLIHHLRQSIMEQRFSPFQGPLYDSDGQLRVFEGLRMEDRAILDMDWMVDGVGRISP